jgi:hypothetical protein
MAAGTMAAHQLQHKGLEFCETTIAELVIKRKITGLTPRAINQSGITTASSLQIKMADTGNKAQTCVLYLRTMAPELAGKNGLEKGAAYVTLRTNFIQNYVSRKAMAAYLSKALGTHGDACLEALARTLNRLPFLGPIFAVGWPLDDPGGPRNQLKKSQKSRKQCLNGTKYVPIWPI